MLCRVEMPTNEQIFGRFYRYRMLHKGAGGGGRMGFVALPLVLVLMAFMTLGFGLPPVVLVVLVALAAAYFGYSFYLKPNQLFRKKGGAALQTEVTIFTDSGFNRSVKSEEGGFPDNTSGQYNTLVAAVETGKDFYLFTSPSQAYLIDKEYFTKGTPEELRETLQKKLGSKFKGKKR